MGTYDEQSEERMPAYCVRRTTQSLTCITERDIEIAVERMTNRLDKAFMRGDLDQPEYDDECSEISAWAEAQYELIKA